MDTTGTSEIETDIENFPVSGVKTLGRFSCPTPSIMNTTLDVDVHKLGKPDVERMFEDKSSRISFIENSSKKSDVWTKYKIVQIDQTSIPFVKCNKCDRFYGWKKQDGTSTLSSHSKICDGSIKITSASKTSQPSIKSKLLQQVSKSAIEELNKEVTIGLAKDIRPLASVDGEGFKRIAQAFINFGAKHGPHLVDTVLQTRFTLKKHMQSTAIQARESMKQKIQTEALLTGNYFSVTFDMWSDLRQRSFVSMTLHYINDSFVIRHPLLGVEQFIIDQDSGTIKTTQNIRDFLRGMLSQYFVADQLENIMRNMTAITDGGSNCTSVFIHQRYSCKCHDLNLVLEWAFEKEDEKETAKTKLLSKKEIIERKIEELKNLPLKANERKKWFDQLTKLQIPRKKEFILSKSCPIIKGTITAVKGLVAYFKQTGLNKHLKYSLKQEVPTRWNSHLITLSSYQKSREEIKHLLCKNNRLDKLQNINNEIVDQLVTVLNIFKECTESLSSDTKPTIHLVAQWGEILYKHLSQTESDLPEITKLKDQLAICLDEYFDLKDLHLGAAMLDPRYVVCYITLIIRVRIFKFKKYFMDPWVKYYFMF